VYGNLVAGAFVPASTTFADTNPADPGDVVGRFPASGAAEVDAAVEAAAAALPAWRRTPPVARGRHLVALARALREREDEIVAAITREQGKPLAESRGEFGKALEYLDYYGALAYEYGGRLLPSARPGVEISIRREPLGVVALLTPWNVPIAIPARKLGPALLAGNTVVLKPSTETPLSAHVLAEAAVAAGIPAGVVNVVHGPGSSTGAALARHPRVAGISFTGSTGSAASSPSSAPRAWSRCSSSSAARTPASCSTTRTSTTPRSRSRSRRSRAPASSARRPAGCSCSGRCWSPSPSGCWRGSRPGRSGPATATACGSGRSSPSGSCAP
jgi:acyl-CoA reductase-like NAD-dependent aldehyde dehydrogenase